METFTKHRRILAIVCVAIGVLLIGVWCYRAGQQNTIRDAHIERVQQINGELGHVGQAIERATGANETARTTATDGIISNERIGQSINASQDANRRTGEAVANAEQLVRQAKQGFATSNAIIDDCKRILETARK